MTCRLVFLAVLLALAAGCQSSTEWGPCIPVDKAHARADRDYRLSIRNTFLAVIFVETIVVPIVVLADETFCPVGPAVRPSSALKRARAEVLKLEAIASDEVTP